MVINYLNITRSDYELVAGDFGVDFDLGEGVDMNYPDNPIGRRNAFGLSEKLPLGKKEIVSVNDFFSSDIRYIESSRIEEYSRTLSMSVRANYGLNSMRLDYNQIKTRNENYYSVIILISDTKTKNGDLGDKEFLEKPTSEIMQDSDDLKTYQFLQDFGSHYIQKMSYGYQIAIEASVQKSKFTDELQFKGSL